MFESNSLETSESFAESESSSYKTPVIALLIIYFLYLVVSNAPASIAAWAAHKAAPNVWLTSPQGTLWKGFAGNTQVDLGGKSYSLGRLDWSLSPLSLLVLRPCLTFSTNGAGQVISGEVCQSPFGSTSIENANFEAPVSMLAGLLPQGFQASGDLSIQVVEADLKKGAYVDELDARFSLQNASANAEGAWISLGAFGGKATQDGGGGLVANIVDIESSIGINMNVQWTPRTSAYSLNGIVTPKQNAPGDIKNLLQAVGEDVGEGSYKVIWP